MDILFDIGGTNMRIARTENCEAYDEPVIVPTPRDFDEGIALIASTVHELLGGKTPGAVAGGVAGTLSPDRMSLANAPHLPGWKGKSFVSALTKALHAPIYLENDTAIVGLGEAIAGAGRRHNSVAYITVSTGVGGARIIEGKIDHGVAGFEPGHQIIDASGGFRKDPSYIGGYGVDLEGMVSGSAVTERYGKKPFEITDDAFWEEMARLLAFGVANTIVHWSPDIVVIGGSMMKKIGIPVPRVAEHVRGILHVYPKLPAIEKAELGDWGGLHGALAYLKTKKTK